MVARSRCDFLRPSDCLYARTDRFYVIVGAALLSLFIIYDWTATSFENVTRLSGSAVSEAIQQKLTFLAYRFASVVDGIKSITAYHAGDKAWVEYDILLPEKMPLASAHDIAETLQYCCEGKRPLLAGDWTLILLQVLMKSIGHS